MRVAAALLLGILLTVPSARAQETRFILDGAAEPYRELIVQALDVLAQRCPEIRLRQPDIGVRLHADPLLSIVPNRNSFGWTGMIEVVTPPYAFSLGGGRRPGIASLLVAGQKGAELCGAPERHGEWAFYSLPELRFLDALGPKQSGFILDTFRKK